MPIKPENKKLYPKNWKEIRKDILNRSGNRCAFCGVSNHAIGYRNEEGEFIECEGMEQEAAEIDREHLFKIVLTIAHLDHDPTNNHPSNLRALCQKCHNKYDAKHRAETRRKSKANLKGQTKLKLF